MTIEIQIQDFEKYSRLVAFLQQLEMPFAFKKEKEVGKTIDEIVLQKNILPIPTLKEIDSNTQIAVLSKIKSGDFMIENFESVMTDFEESRQDRVLF